MARKSRKNLNLSSAKTENGISRTGVYLRLSIADNGLTDGNSMDNQRNYVINRLTEFADVSIEKIYIENGHTGTTYDRAVWQELISDIMAGKINCIAVKDFSRMGRNHLETSNYIEKVFPFLGVRVISLNDNYDSNRDNFNRSLIDACFKNLMNECYSRDISKKIRTGIQARRKSGFVFSGHISYGYKKADDKRSLVIDENTAPVVKQIFKWRKNGKRLCEIIKILNELAIPSPGRYLYMKSDGTKYIKYANSRWSFANVRFILSDLTYTGCLVQNKTSSSVFNVGKREERLDRSKWEVTENAHEAIVSVEDFEYIQTFEKKKYTPTKNVYFMKGKIKCGLCGYNMSKIIKRDDRVYYACISQKSQLKEPCGCYIYENELFHIIRKCVDICLDLMDKKIQLIKAIQGSKEYKALLQEHNKQKAHITGEIRSLKNKSIMLYENFKNGIISESDYTDFKAEYKAKINTKSKQLEALEKKAEKEKIAEKNAKALNKYIEEINNHNFSNEYISSLVQTIFVYPNNKAEVKFIFADKLEAIDSFIDDYAEVAI